MVLQSWVRTIKTVTFVKEIIDTLPKHGLSVKDNSLDRLSEQFTIVKTDKQL